MANSVERYYQKKKKRKKKAKVVFFTLLFVLMMLTLAILSITVFFNAETIEVGGSTHYSKERILAQGGLEEGQNMFRMDKFEVIEKIQQLPYVKSVTINRKLPNTLEITIVENEPVAWVVASDGRVALLNEEYRVLELLSISADQFPDDPQVLLAEEEEMDRLQQSIEQSKNPQEEEQEPLEEVIEEEPEEETEEQEPEEEPAPKEVHPRLKNIPRLTPLKAVSPAVGQTVAFSDKTDYVGFLKAIYDAMGQTKLEWKKVRLVQFKARYDIRIVYGDKVIIDFGRLDQVEEKLKLAEHLLQKNGTAQTAILDVSNVERVYYRSLK